MGYSQIFHGPRLGSGPELRRGQEGGEAIRGMGKPWENHGKTMGKLVKLGKHGTFYWWLMSAKLCFLANKFMVWLWLRSIWLTKARLNSALFDLSNNNVEILGYDGDMMRIWWRDMQMVPNSFATNNGYGMNLWILLPFLAICLTVKSGF